MFVGSKGQLRKHHSLLMICLSQRIPRLVKLKIRGKTLFFSCNSLYSKLHLLHCVHLSQINFSKWPMQEMHLQTCKYHTFQRLSCKIHQFFLSGQKSTNY